MSTDPSMQEYADTAREILGNLLRLLQLDVAVPEATEEGGQLFFQIETEEAGRIIGRACQNLDALQFILNRMMSRRFEDAPYCVVDAGHYREQRREKSSYNPHLHDAYTTFSTSVTGLRGFLK